MDFLIILAAMNYNNTFLFYTKNELYIFIKKDLRSILHYGNN